MATRGKNNYKPDWSDEFAVIVNSGSSVWIRFATGDLYAEDSDSQLSWFIFNDGENNIFRAGKNTLKKKDRLWWWNEFISPIQEAFQDHGWHVGSAHKAERGPGGVEGTYIFVACFFTQLCRVNKEDTAAGVNRFVIAKIYLICPGFGRHLINHPICLLCFPAGLRINNIRDPSPVLLECAPMKASLCHFRVIPLALHFYQWYTTWSPLKGPLLIVYLQEGPIFISMW